MLLWKGSWYPSQPPSMNIDCIFPFPLGTYGVNAVTPIQCEPRTIHTCTRAWQGRHKWKPPLPVTFLAMAILLPSRASGGKRRSSKATSASAIPLLLAAILQPAGESVIAW
jgi:hypothetical protein